MKKGLVLEGGAMRGLFTAGVTDVMLEENIGFDGMIGVSAGAAFGCNYKSRQPGRCRRYNLTFCKDPRYCSIRSLITTGDLYGAEFDYHEIPGKLDPFDDKTFRENPMEFYCVCTDADTAMPVYHKLEEASSYESLEWIRASASMPMVSRAVELEGRRLLDGGITDPIPLKFFQNLGYEKNVVVLTQPSDYVKRPMKGLKAARLLLKEFPAVADELTIRHYIYNRETEYVREQEEKGTAFVIRPAVPLGISRVCHDPAEIERVYEIGRSTAKAVLEQLKGFLEEE